MKRGKKRRRFPSFVGLPREMLKSPEWRKGLSKSEKILYIHLKSKYVGHNNGEICLHYSEMKDMMSPGTISNAFKSLENKEWIERERTVGGKYRFTTYYRLTGKHDTAISKFNF